MHHFWLSIDAVPAAKGEDRAIHSYTMTGATDGARASKFSVKAINPKSPAAFFAAQEHSVQKSAKSEPGRKIRSVSADVPDGLEHRPSGSQTPLQDAEVSGRSYKSKPGNPVPASPKGNAIAPFKFQSRAASGRETPTTVRSQVTCICRHQIPLQPKRWSKTLLRMVAI